MSRACDILTVTPNAALDRTLFVPGFTAGAVNRVERQQEDVGGKGVNVAMCLVDAWAVTATGFLGEANDEPFIRGFAEAGITDQFVRVPSETRVNVKIVDEPAQRVTDVNGPGPAVRASDVAALIDRVAASARATRWAVLSGSLPVGAPADLYAQLIAAIRAANPACRIVVDTSGEPLRAALAARPDVVKPNVHELAELIGAALNDDSDVLAAARKLIGDGVRTVAVSMGERGAVFADARSAVLAVPPAITIKSTVGAGDAMVAGLVDAHLRGLPLTETARHATGFSLASLSRIGARLGDVDDVRALAERVEVRAM